jgi:hypothetical protein
MVNKLVEVGIIKVKFDRSEKGMRGNEEVEWEV